LNEVDEIVRTGTSILLSYIDLLKHRAILWVPKLNFHSSPPLYQGVTQAEKLAGLYMTKWQGNVDPVFREFMYWSVVALYRVRRDPWFPEMGNPFGLIYLSFRTWILDTITSSNACFTQRVTNASTAFDGSQ
jgi:hypothetical protein